MTQVISLSCMKPKSFGHSHEIWNQRLLTKHIRENCIKEGQAHQYEIKSV